MNIRQKGPYYEGVYLTRSTVPRAEQYYERKRGCRSRSNLLTRGKPGLIMCTGDIPLTHFLVSGNRFGDSPTLLFENGRKAEEMIIGRSLGEPVFPSILIRSCVVLEVITGTRLYFWSMEESDENQWTTNAKNPSHVSQWMTLTCGNTRSGNIVFRG